MGDTCKEMDAIKVERWGRKGFAARRQVGVGVGWGLGGVGWSQRALPAPGSPSKALRTPASYSDEQLI